MAFFLRILLNGLQVIFKRGEAEFPYPAVNLSFNSSPFEPPPLKIDEGGSFFENSSKSMVLFEI